MTEKIAEIFTMTNIRDILTLLGGTLGFISFYYQFLRKFKPTFTVGNQVTFNLGGRSQKSNLKFFCMKASGF